MAKFRSNHQKSTVKPGFGKIVRFILMVVVLGILVWQGKDKLTHLDKTQEDISRVANIPAATKLKGEMVQNEFFTLLYDEDHEQARWVAYELTRDNLKKKRLKRLSKFNVDRSIKTGSAHTKDYSHSGYTRGHLVPSADMSYSHASMQEAYKMSNVSPQISSFNGGIWRELEEQTRDWAYKFKKLHIVTGPILTQVEKTIGRNEVSVPNYFFKVILDADDPERKGIGFIFPHEISYKHLNKYAVTVDQVEQITGIDFFDGIINDREEEILESSVDVSLWPFDDRRFELRKNQWNKSTSN